MSFRHLSAAVNLGPSGPDAAARRKPLDDQLINIIITALEEAIAALKAFGGVRP
jgi:hypothetical protein